MVLSEKLAHLPWWHSIQLPDGSVTPGKKSLETLMVEEEAVFGKIQLEGRSVLDVGAWDGYFSFAAERRGASRVTASDHFCWVGTGWGSLDCFSAAKEILDSRVKPWVIPADLISDHFEDIDLKFDYILLLGVIYHVKNPVKLLERMRKAARIGVVVETHYINDRQGSPVLHLFPGDELGGDPTNWTAPNKRGLEAMLSMAGFSDFQIVESPAAPQTRLIAHCWI
jgi:tRNA (mo5U34)-methyltransferase